MMYRITKQFLLFTPLIVISLGLILFNRASILNEEDKSIISIAMPKVPTDFKPYGHKTHYSSNVLKMIYEGLTRINELGEPDYALANGHSLSDDKRTYTFKLKQTTWSDGSPLTSRDFKKSWLSALTFSELDYGSTNYLSLIKNAKKMLEDPYSSEPIGIKCPDDYTLIVTLEHPAPYFLELLAFETFFPVHPSNLIYNPKTSKHADIITNGPFIVKKASKHSIELIRNNEYWDKHHVKLDKIIISRYEDEALVQSLFESNKVQWIGAPFQRLSLDYQEHLQSKDRLFFNDTNYAYWLIPNLNQAPFDSIQFRHYFSKLINRTEITNHLSSKHHPSRQFFPPSLSDDILEDTEFNSQYFDQKYNDSNYKVELGFPSSQQHKLISELIRAQVESASNIKMRISPLTVTVYHTKKREGNYQLIRDGWKSRYLDKMSWLEYFSSKNNFLNNGWHNDEFEAILDELKYSKNNEMRSHLEHKAHEILKRELPCIPVMYESSFHSHSEQLYGAYMTPHNNIEFKYASIKKGNQS